MGKLFVDEYFPEVAENAAQQMLGDIRGAFEEHLETLHWMDADTRESAVEKLENMGYQVRCRVLSRSCSLALSRSVSLSLALSISLSLSLFFLFNCLF